ncbi:MAG: hypothetical protein FJ279_08435 [Planctomycetes bacterium]|nr:hypothetical protein [Planctomycetota bacterium]
MSPECAQERRLQEARAFQETEEFREAKKRRQVVEQRIARLVQLGVRQARYFGRRSGDGDGVNGDGVRS